MEQTEINESIRMFEFKKTRYIHGDVDKVRKSNGRSELSLTTETLEELEQLNLTRKIFTIGTNSLTPRNYIGTIKVGKITLEILPKLFKDESENRIPELNDNLLKIFSYAGILFGNQSYRGSSETKISSMLELFIHYFAENLLQLLNRTQPRKYLRQYEELRNVKERIDKRHYNNPARLHRIPCIFHERSLNHIINRTLKYSTHLMISIVKDPRNFLLLQNVNHYLDLVDSRPVQLDTIEHIVFDRMTEDFRPFIEFCKVFLSNSTFTFKGGRIISFSFLYPMEKLYEIFLTRVIQNERLYLFSNVGKVIPQKIIGSLIRTPENLTLYKLKPDILLTPDSNACGKKFQIIDMKYKRLSRDKSNFGVSNADIYQMYAYATKFLKDNQVGKILLLYPKFSHLSINETWDLNLPKLECKLLIRTINLDHDFNSEDGWNAFVQELKEILSDIDFEIETDYNGLESNPIII